MSIYDQMRVLPVGGARFASLGAGTYEVEIIRCVSERGMGQGGAESFVCEFTVLASNNPEHPAGSTRKWLQGLRYPTSLSDVAALVAAALGVDASKQGATLAPEFANALGVAGRPLNEQIAACMPHVLGPANVLAGRRARTEVTLKPPKPGKQPWPAHAWMIATGAPMPAPVAAAPVAQQAAQPFAPPPAAAWPGAAAAPSPAFPGSPFPPGPSAPATWTAQAPAPAAPVAQPFGAPMMPPAAAPGAFPGFPAPLPGAAPVPGQPRWDPNTRTFVR